MLEGILVVPYVVNLEQPFAIFNQSSRKASVKLEGCKLWWKICDQQKKSSAREVVEYICSYAEKDTIIM